MGLGLTASKYREFVRRTGQTDYLAYFGIGYRGAPVAAPKLLPDFGAYFSGRVPDWPDTPFERNDLQPWPGASGYYTMGEHNTAMNEWGEYRVYGSSRDYHKKIYALDGPEIGVHDVLAYPFPDYFADYRYEGLGEAIGKIHAEGHASVLSCQMTIFEKAWRIRGLEELLADFLINPDLAACVLGEVARRTGYQALRYAQAGVDIVELGDDVGTEHEMLISPEVWRRFLKPLMAELIGALKAGNPDVLVFYHSDGFIEPIIPDLIEIGLDILNPVPPESMDIVKLQRLYGDRLSFWGGIGVQTTMPFGSPRQVAETVRRMIGEAGRGGGFLIAPAHVLEPDVPWENIEAFVEAVDRHGAYS